jgi:hypothetical protein
MFIGGREIDEEMRVQASANFPSHFLCSHVKAAYEAAYDGLRGCDVIVAVKAGLSS